MRDLGMGKDTEMVVNCEGGKQSHVPYRMDLVPPEAILEVGKVLSQGAVKYGENNWKLIKTNEHINHAISHLYAYLAGDMSDEHLAHATCRLLFALDIELKLVQH